MFGSQALETAIGLALMFFLFASAASAITEVFAAATKKRAGDLETALKEMLESADLPGGAGSVAPEDVKKLIKRATGQASASYLSAKSFADAAAELVAKGENIGALQAKMDSLARQARGRLDAVKAGLETWFDQTMAVAQDTYARWASWALFGTGLVLAVVLNASVIHVGQDLWSDAAARDAVVAAVEKAEGSAAECNATGTAAEQAKCSVENISAFSLPIGWGEEQTQGLADGAGSGAWWLLTHVVGWFLTAVLLMLGAPFWFDLLGRLVNLRAGGQRPKVASDDDSSYTTKVTKTPPAAPPHQEWVPVAPVVLANLVASGAVSTPAAFEGMSAQAQADLLKAAPPTALAPPATTDAQAVDWLATALNLGVPMEAVSTGTT